MIEKEDIRRAVEKGLDSLGRDDLFVVEIKARPGSEFDVFIDSDTRVTVDDCILLSKAIEGQFDRDEEDFALTVSSAGIGQPLRAPRQYRKLTGKPVELLLNDGTKILGTLDRADEKDITVSYPEKRTVEGKKRPETVTVTKTFSLGDVKTTKEHLDFK